MTIWCTISDLRGCKLSFWLIYKEFWYFYRFDF
nr:MAG TPA: hypothetical protein [Caudoviricetes sp.]